MAFAYVYMLIQQAGPIASKIWENKELETVFRSFLNNINQLMVDYQHNMIPINTINTINISIRAAISSALLTYLAGSFSFSDS